MFLNKLKTGTMYGPVLTLLVALSLAARDVLLSDTFQHTSVFLTIISTFFPIVVCILIYRAFKENLFVLFKGMWGLIVKINVFNAVAFILFLFALKFCHPVYVAVVFGSIRWVVMYIAEPDHVGYSNHTKLIVPGLLLVTFFVFVIALLDSPLIYLVGLVLALLSGGISSYEVFYEKEMSKRNIGATTILALRFMLLILVSFGVAVVQKNDFSDLNMTISEYILLFSVTALPAFFAQVAIANTYPITFVAIFSLIPAFIFLISLIYGLSEISALTSLVVLVYSLTVVVGNYLHGWRTRGGS